MATELTSAAISPQSSRCDGGPILDAAAANRFGLTSDSTYLLATTPA